MAADITVRRGDTLEFDQQLINQNGGALDLKKCTVYWLAEVAGSDTDEQAKLFHTLVVDSDGAATATPAGSCRISNDNATTGIVEHRLTAADTLSLSVGSLVWACKVTSPGAWDDDDVTTILTGTMDVLEQLIEAGSE